MEKQQKQNTPNKEMMTDRLAKASMQGLMIDFALNALVPGVGQVVGMAAKMKTAKRIGKSVAKSVASETAKITTEDTSKKQEDDFKEQLALEVLERGMGR